MLCRNNVVISLKGRFVSYLIATCALIAAWFAQFFVVFPVESAIRGDGSGVIAYSYLFLPHGIKVLVALLFMASGLPIIFGVQLLAGVYFGNDLPYAVWGALLGSIAVLAPLWLINLTMNRKLNQRIWNIQQSNFSLFRLTFAVCVAAALLNSVAQATLAQLMLQIEANYTVQLGFLIGDIFGGFVCVIAAIMIARYMLRRYGYAF